MSTIELLSFGNELLIGEILNTNAYWLAQTLKQAGGIVTRMVTISDDFQNMKSVFEESLGRNPDIIISTGGLGPTWDDQTLIALAKAVNKPIVRNKDALDMIENKYKNINLKLMESGKTMANLPEGSTPLINPVGTAPGVLLCHDSTHIFCLPGVPKEMKAIVRKHVLPLIQNLNPEISFYEAKFDLKNTYESYIAETVALYAKKYSSIYIKSHPKKQGLITLHLTCFGSKKEKALLEKVKLELTQELSNFGNIEF